VDDQANQEGHQSSARGEAAWKAERERVAARNQAARKAGKARREAYERERDEVRHAAERQRHAKLVTKGRAKSSPRSP
jgi:hypothetical protein